jgi:hypothetical protein
MNIAAVFILTLWLAAIGGWIANIVKFVGMMDGGVTTMFIARIVGVVAAPLGAVLGYF